MDTEITQYEVLQILVEHDTKFIPTTICEKCKYQRGFFVHGITTPEPIDDVPQSPVVDLWRDDGCNCHRHPYSHKKTGIGELIALYNDQTDDAGRERVLKAYEGVQI